MKVLNMSSNSFNELKLFSLPSNVFKNEGDLFVFEENGNKHLIKKLHKHSGTVFSNKLYTINELIDKKEQIGIKELVFPERLIAVHNKIIGFSMPLIDNINFQTILDSSEFSVEQKIKYFKEIGEILEKMRNIRENTPLEDFYLNDMHENNFILNKETGKINVVDLDSCKINSNLTFGSRYLSLFAPISNVSKYKQDDDSISIGAYFKVNQNTDYYCYTLMILNYLFGGMVIKLNIEQFYDYLSYLHSIGISNELIDVFSLIYMEKDNVNPYEYLDELVNVVDKCHCNAYRLNRKK